MHFDLKGIGRPFEGCGNGVVVSQLNIRSLFHKIDELSLFLEHHSTSHVMVVSETWLDETVTAMGWELLVLECIGEIGTEGQAG